MAHLSKVRHATSLRYVLSAQSALICENLREITRLQMPKEWFSEWFGSPYYPILYGNRDESEAQHFIQKISKHLQLPTNAKVLDLACGRGRHAVELNRLGYEVRGWDISAESIADAQQFANPHLQFSVLDMRNDFPEGNFDAILNLFTSFGYFENLAENQLVLQHIAKALKAEGKWVLDFFNPEYVRKIMIPFEVKILQNISFLIRKSIEHGFVHKQIHIIDGEKVFNFSEKVQLIEKEQFEAMFIKAGLQVEYIWEDGGRLVFIGKKGL